MTLRAATCSQRHLIDSLAMTATTKMILLVIVALVLVFVVLIVLGLATSVELEG